MNNSLISKQNKYFWDSTEFLSNIKNLKNEDSYSFIGNIIAIDEENNFILTTNKKGQNCAINFKNLATQDLIFYDSTLNQIFFKNKIKYDLIVDENIVKLNNTNFYDLIYYRNIYDIQLQRKNLFKLIHIPKILDKFVKKRQGDRKDYLVSRLKTIKITNEFVDDFWFKFKKKVVWQLIIQANKKNYILKGLILRSTPFQGVIVSIGNLYLFFMPTSHLTLKRIPRIPIYLTVLQYVVGHIIEFKILSLNLNKKRLPAISYKNIFFKSKRKKNLLKKK